MTHYVASSNSPFSTRRGVLVGARLCAEHQPQRVSSEKGHDISPNL